MTKPRVRYYLALMRLHRPIGFLLLLWPTLWAIWIASHGQPSVKIIVIFILGVIVMRSAGCVINDIADREFDAHVTRTQNRPLAAKNISVIEALIILSLLLVLALILVLQLNFFTIKLSLIGLLLAAIYPFSKRFIDWPQVILGLAFSWGIPMAFAAQGQPLSLTCWLLYAAAVLWPLAYDTQYAMVDREDDLKIGVKSTAISFGKWDILLVSIFQIAMLILLIILGITLHVRIAYYICLAGAGLLFVYQNCLIQQREPVKCFKAFLNNNWVGLSIFMGLLLNYHHLVV